MIQNAIKKIKDEMDKTNNPYVKVVGQFLLQHLDNTPESADKIIQEDKTILKSLDEMRKEAAKKKVGNCAVLTDQEGFEIVLRYFGIEVKEVNITYEPPKEEKKAPVKRDIDFDVKLDDLLI